MASANEPLLENREATTFVSSLKNMIRKAATWRLWPKISDGLILSLVPVAIACSFYVLLSATSSSPCRGDLSFFKVVLLLLPIGFIMPGVLITSTVIRQSSGAEEPAAYRLIQLLFGLLLGAWFSLCVFNSSAWVLLVLFLLAGAFYACGPPATDE